MTTSWAAEQFEKWELSATDLARGLVRSMVVGAEASRGGVAQHNRRVMQGTIGADATLSSGKPQLVPKGVQELELERVQVGEAHVADVDRYRPGHDDVGSKLRRVDPSLSSEVRLNVGSSSS